MIIRYKGIIHERTQDAPFIGALISSIDCKFNCKNCCNKHLLSDKILYKDSIEIIKEIKVNKFNEGIILGGLEWSLQYDEMLELIKQAKKNNLKVIVYTGLEEFNIGVRDIYVKYGRYKESYKVEDNIQYNVKLASSNQKIKYEIK